MAVPPAADGTEGREERSSSPPRRDDLPLRPGVAGTRVADVERDDRHWTERFRIAIFAIKLVTGTSELASGVALLVLSPARMQHALDVLTAHEAVEDPTDMAMLFMQHRLPFLLTGKTWIAVALLALGLAKLVGAVGLLMRRAWGVYLLASVLVAVLPEDALHFAAHPTLFGGVFLAVNVLVLVVLVACHRGLAEPR